jgi:hypothetical protein
MPSVHSRHWLTSCNLLCAGLCEARPAGCHLTTLFGYTAVMPIVVPHKKRSFLPLLTVVFLLSYGLMTMLIVEQGAVIQSQRNLIQILMRDSTELWGMKGKAVVDQPQALGRGQAPSAQIPSAQAPSTQTPATQIPSTQIPSTKTPSTQAVPQHRSQSRAGKIARPQPHLPPMPASDLVDQRRTLVAI